jgi:hypothetical protein
VRLVIEGAAPYDGEYELDLDSELTTREWGWVKRLAGYLPLALDEQAFGDPEFVCVLAAIALKRARRVEASEVPATFERLVDAPFGSTIRLIPDPDEPAEDADAGPPVASSSENGSSSGDASRTSSETSAATRSGSGTPGSASLPSSPATSGS